LSAPLAALPTSQARKPHGGEGKNNRFRGQHTMFTALWPIAARDRVEYRKLAVRNRTTDRSGLHWASGTSGPEEHAYPRGACCIVPKNLEYPSNSMHGCSRLSRYSYYVFHLNAHPDVFSGRLLCECRSVVVSELHARTGQDETCSDKDTQFWASAQKVKSTNNCWLFQRTTCCPVFPTHTLAS
jgi:hypothetical protein